MTIHPFICLKISHGGSGGCETPRRALAVTPMEVN